MFASLIVIRRIDNTVVEEPISINLTREEKRELQCYFDSYEMPRLDIKNPTECAGYSKKIIEVQHIISSLGPDLAMPSLDDKTLFLNGGDYTFKISIYSYGV